MYQVNEQIRQALAGGVCALRLRGGGAEQEVIKAQLTSSCCGGESITIGAVCAAKLTATVYGGHLASGDTVTLEAKVKTAPEPVYLPLGSFIVSTWQQGEETEELTAYDAASYLLGGDYAPAAGEEPSTALAVLEDVCGKCGLELGDVSGLTDQPVSGKLTGHTCREMVGYMAALLGCNAVIDREGRLALRWFSDFGQSLTPDDYYAGSLKLETPQTLTGLRMVRRDTSVSADTDGIVSELNRSITYEAGSGSGLVIQVDNPFATQEITDAVWEKIQTLGMYRPGSCSCFGCLTTEPGDIVTLTAPDGTRNHVPAMSVVLELDGGCKATLESTGHGELASAGLQGTMGKLLTKLEADLARFKELTADNFSAAQAKINSLYADKAWVRKLFSQNITARALKIGGASEFGGIINGASAKVGGIQLGIPDNSFLYQVGFQTSVGDEVWNRSITLPKDEDVPANLRLMYVGLQVKNKSKTEEDTPLSFSVQAGDYDLMVDNDLVQYNNPQETLFPVLSDDITPYGMTASISARDVPPETTILISFYSGYRGSAQFQGDITADNALIGGQKMLLSGTSVTYINLACGIVTNASKRVDLLIPLARPLKQGASVSCTSLTMTLRHADGGYPFLRSGTNGGTYTQLGASQVSVWNKGKAVRSNEIASLTCVNRGDSIRLQMELVNTLAKASGNTASVTNNVPVMADVVGVFAIG